MGNLTVTVPRRTRARIRPLVVVLHTPAEAALALHLIRAWAPTVPAGCFVGAAVEPCDLAAVTERLQTLMRDGVQVPEHTILVGICGAANLALRIGLAPDAWAFAGVLVCGPMLVPLSPFAQGGTASGARLRLIWTAQDSLQVSAALGALLQYLREAGLDAQGAVLGSPYCGPGYGDEGCARAVALVRLSGAYLAELVAYALGPSSPIQATPAAEVGAGALGEGWCGRQR